MRMPISTPCSFRITQPSCLLINFSMTTSTFMALNTLVKKLFASSTTASSTTKFLTASSALRSFLLRRSDKVFFTAAATALAVSTCSLTASLAESMAVSSLAFTLLLKAVCFTSISSALAPALRKASSALSIAFSPKAVALAFHSSTTESASSVSPITFFADSALGVTKTFAFRFIKPNRPFLGSTRISKSTSSLVNFNSSNAAFIASSTVLPVDSIIISDSL